MRSKDIVPGLVDAGRGGFVGQREITSNLLPDFKRDIEHVAGYFAGVGKE